MFLLVINLINRFKNQGHIIGVHGKPIVYDICRLKNNKALPVLIIAHGFKGYKDWGHFNLISESFAKEGFAVIKFNFSHNGGTLEQPIDFPDLEAFANNNFTIELDDLGCVIDWLFYTELFNDQKLNKEDLSLLGHSRGGAITILKANEDERVKKIVSWAAVSSMERWDDEILDRFGIPRETLPVVKSSSSVVASVNSDLFGGGAPISGVAGDQQAALFGQGCFQLGMAKNTYGTGCFVISNTGSELVYSKHGLLTTVAWKINGKTHYALEGSIFIAGAVVQWLRDGLKIIRTSQEVETLASSVSSSEGVFFVPAFAGLGAPHWNQQAQGTLFGLTRGSTDAHIARAAIESIAFQTMDVLKAMQADAGIAVKELRVDGGATINNMLMQFQSDVLNTKTVRPKVVETTAMGAAFLAGLAVGYWQSPEEIQDIWQIDRTFTPSHLRAPIDEQIKGWYKAIEALEYWAKIN